MSDHLMDDLTESQSQRKALRNELREALEEKEMRALEHQQMLEREHVVLKRVHDRGLCGGGCIFCQEALKGSEREETPPDLKDLHKTPSTIKEPEGLAATMQARGSRYGDYDHMAAVAQYLKDTLHSGASWGRISLAQRESLEMIATKMARIVCGDPNLPDSWLDIEGYARLSRDRIPQAPAFPATP